MGRERGCDLIEAGLNEVAAVWTLWGVVMKRARHSVTIRVGSLEPVRKARMIYAAFFNGRAR